MIVSSWKKMGLAFFLKTFLVSLPMFLVGMNNLALTSLAVSVLYLLIWGHLSIYYKLGISLGWSATKMMIIGLFVVKNLFFLAFLAIMFSLKYIDTPLSTVVAVLSYLFYGLLIGKFSMTFLADH